MRTHGWAQSFWGESLMTTADSVGNSKGAEEEEVWQRSHCLLGGFNVISWAQQITFLLFHRKQQSLSQFFLDCVTLITNTAKGIPGHYCKAKESLKDQGLSSTKILILSMKLENESQRHKKRNVNSCHRAVAGVHSCVWNLQDHVLRCSLVS